MRTVILTAVILTIATSLSAQVNRFVFASGIQSSVWNQSVFNKTYAFYFNMSDEENYFLYQEAVRVVTENGFDFYNPTNRTDVSDGPITLTNIIYENITYGSNAYSDLIYESDDIKIWVHLSEKGSAIRVYYR